MIRKLQKHRLRPRLAALGAVLALGVVWIGALYFSPTAHAHVHNDAHEADHHCVVEVFADGVLSDVLELQVSLLATVVTAERVQTHDVWVGENKHLRPPGRAPPLG